MRFVYSSARLETAEGVAELLRQNGIETLMRNGRGYKGGRRSHFSYRDQPSNTPEVWVVNNDDQVRAREILREAHLIDTTRDRPSYLVDLEKRDTQRASAQRKGLWVRFALLGLLIAVIAVMGYRSLMNANPAPQPLAGPFDGKPRSMPTQLVVPGLSKGIELGVMPVLCLSYDGLKPPQDLMGRLNGNGKIILPSNHCVRNEDPEYGSVSGNGDPAEFVEVRNFRPQSATQGLIDVNTFHHSQWAHYRTFEVKLENGQWRIGKMTRHVAS